jgi:hypothetical protein
MELLHSIGDDTFKSIFANVFDGRVLNIEYFYSQRVEQVPVDFLHVAVVNGESVNEGPDLSEANGQGGNVRVIAMYVHALFTAFDTSAWKYWSFRAIILWRWVNPVN